MPRPRLALLSLLVAQSALAALTACAAPSPRPVAPASIDWGAPVGAAVLIHGGTVRLGAGRVAPALWIEEGRVVAAGDLAELAARAPHAMRIDLAGATLVPGLHDAHGHIEGLGSSLERVDLRGSSSFEDVIARVAARAAEQAPGTWILGRGWDQTLWPGGEFPHHAALSAAVPDHPVLLERVDGHAALANARALELAGVEGVVRIDGGLVRVDAAGRPTGMLIDRAVGLVEAVVPESSAADVRRRILLAQTELLSAGLVAVHDMGIGPEALSVFEQLAADGELRLRVFAYLWANEGLPAETRARYPAEVGRLSVVGAKLMVDGALGSRGAALLAPYADEPGQLGIPILSATALEFLLRQLADAGLQPATHAIGDAGNRLVLVAYEQAMARYDGFAALRPRIEHAQVVAPEDRARFALLGVVPSIQPTHATSDMRWAEQRLGALRMEGAYAWRRLAPDTSALALGSDFPVESHRPLLGIHAARTRQDREGWPPGGFQPDQRLSGDEALNGFSRGAARAVRREADLGLLAPGYRADFVVLDVDPVTCPPADLLTARVLLTVIEGEAVYRAE